jgi:hypothetical protein
VRIQYSVMLLAISCCCLIGPGCGDRDRPLAKIDQLSKDYCSFSTGSYWIYQKVASNIFDTVSIHFVQKKVVSIPELETFDFEEIRMQTIWSSYGNRPNESSPEIKILGYWEGAEDIPMVEERTPWYRGPNVIFTPFQNVGEFKSFYQYDTLRLIEKLDSIIIADSTYRDILVFQTTRASNSSRHEISYWSKNIGRIRFVNFGGEVWDLVAHHAIQN